MSDLQARTLASLDAFLEEQRKLLVRTQSDLHKLSQLRERALEHPEEFLENIEQELDDRAFKLSRYETLQMPHDIDWGLFTSLDPSPFSEITLPGPPPLSAATKQRSAPSELQTFVREASKKILADFKPFVANEQEEGDAEAVEADADSEDVQRLVELVKSGKDSTQLPMIDLDIDEVQPRRRRVGSGLRPKPSHEAIVLETGDVAATKGKVALARQTIPRIEAEPQNSSPSVLQRPKRTRRPTARADGIYQDSQPPLPRSPPPEPNLRPLAEAVFGPDVPMHTGRAKDASESDSTSDGESALSHEKKKVKRLSSRGRKATSETFNLPWSLSEQHLLEKLLEEIPAGEKQRWAKISKAMAGRRSARQVASRVQKYFEKLKKFGVDPG